MRGVSTSHPGVNPPSPPYVALTGCRSFFATVGPVVEQFVTSLREHSVRRERERTTDGDPGNSQAAQLTHRRSTRDNQHIHQAVHCGHKCGDVVRVFQTGRVDNIRARVLKRLQPFDRVS